MITDTQFTAIRRFDYVVFVDSDGSHLACVGDKVPGTGMVHAYVQRSLTTTPYYAEIHRSSITSVLRLEPVR